MILTDAQAIVVFAVALVAIIAMGLAWWKQNPIAWLVSAIFWIFFTAAGFILSMVLWDIFFFMGWIGSALFIVSVLMSLRTREQAEKEEAPEDEDDVDDYSEEAERYRERQKKISEATRRKERRR